MRPDHILITCFLKRLWLEDYGEANGLGTISLSSGPVRIAQDGRRGGYASKDEEVENVVDGENVDIGRGVLGE